MHDMACACSLMRGFPDGGNARVRAPEMQMTTPRMSHGLDTVPNQPVTISCAGKSAHWDPCRQLQDEASVPCTVHYSSHSSLQAWQTSGGAAL